MNVDIWFPSHSSASAAGGHLNTSSASIICTIKAESTTFHGTCIQSGREEIHWSSGFLALCRRDRVLNTKYSLIIATLCPILFKAVQKRERYARD